MPSKIKAQITVIVYASNDERNIERAVLSAHLLTTNVVLIDIGSTDRTTDIAKRLGAHVVTFEPTPYVELVRMEGIRHAKTDWAFILDSDEVITAELADRITSILTYQKTDIQHPLYSYGIPRKNIFGKSKWLKHGGWWPDFQTRLIKRSALREWPSVIHSTPKIEGARINIREPLMHYSHGDFSQMVHKTIKFEGVESNLLFKAGKQASTITFFRKFLGELYRRLIKQKGFLDGKEGFAESIYQAYSKTVTYLLLYEKNRSL